MHEELVMTNPCRRESWLSINTPYLLTTLQPPFCVCIYKYKGEVFIQLLINLV